MRIFYKQDTHHLIVTPFRCGSSHLNNFLDKYNLLNVSYFPLFKSILHKIKKKTFIYRDPFERWVSLYYAFIYLHYVHDTDPENNRKPKTPILSEFNPIIPHKRSENFWEDLYEATKILKQINIMSPHLLSQYNFFETFDIDENLSTYEIISIKNYVNWINLTFNDTIQHETNLNYLPIKLSDIDLINEIKGICKDIYYKDYTLLFPHLDNS